MKADHSVLLQSNPILEPDAKTTRVWRTALLIIAVVLIWLFAWHKDTALSTIAIWQRSETFTHGFLIFPISAYLIWTRRHDLFAIQPRPSMLGIFALAVAGFAWLLADSAEVLVVAQYALVAMVPILVWAILGHRVALALLFPLLFLMFAVPVGEFLLPPLMTYTADFTVAALQITGVPVYREGNLLALPTGNWSVVEACSGLRYLIASLTLGCLFAYLTYRSVWRRAVFIGLAIVVPIIANWVRAYLIVMIGHLSNNRLAAGVDHLIYGWVFFGFVMLLLFWIGSRWREADPELVKSLHLTHEALHPANTSLKKLIAAACISMAVIAVWPSYARHLDATPANSSAIALGMPSSVANWAATPESLTNWDPHFPTAKNELKQSYQKYGKSVELLIKFYRNQQQGSELINSQNQLVLSHDTTWRQVSNVSIRIPLASGSMDVTEAQLRSADHKLLVWAWYWVGGIYTDNTYLAKLYQAKAKLLNQGDDAAAIFMYAPYDEKVEPAREVLRDFAAAVVPAVNSILPQAAR